MVEETVGEEDVTEEEEEKEALPFPTATIVREMKKHIDPKKMIKKEVKIAMNKFLGEITKEISQRLDKNPYSMLDYRMFEEAVKPFKQTKELQAEKERIKARLEAVIQDCESLKRDLEAKFGE